MENTGKYGCRTFFIFREASGFPAAALLTVREQVAKLWKKSWNQVIFMDIYERTALILGEEAMRVLARSRVAVFGLGGVGGYVAEALARCGVGAMDLIDSDRISPSNLNRQILATADTVGQWKTDVAEARAHSINPACKVTLHRCFYLPDTAAQFDFTQYDYIVDAIDTVTGKLMLAEEARRCVEICKYPPEGIRGYGPRRSQWYGGMSDADYFKQANDSILQGGGVCSMSRHSEAAGTQRMQAGGAA